MGKAILGDVFELGHGDEAPETVVSFLCLDGMQQKCKLHSNPSAEIGSEYERESIHQLIAKEWHLLDRIE